MHKVFISYHHANDQAYRDELSSLNQRHRIFVDVSVDTGDIDDARLTDQCIRETIRDDYLRDSTVTLVLVGAETSGRKHVDWEIYSSMYDGLRNKKSGIIAVMLPSVSLDFFTTAHDGEKALYTGVAQWESITERIGYERRYPGMPARLIDNLLEPNAKISVCPWSRLTVHGLTFLIAAAHKDREVCKYNLSRPMRRANA